ncbi:hypothetical protein M91_18029, partial [Bos mutus]
CVCVRVYTRAGPWHAAAPPSGHCGASHPARPGESGGGGQEGRRARGQRWIAGDNVLMGCRVSAETRVNRPSHKPPERPERLAPPDRVTGYWAGAERLLLDLKRSLEKCCCWGRGSGWRVSSAGVFYRHPASDQKNAPWGG